MPKEISFYTTFLFVFIFINVFIYFLIQLKGSERLFKKLFLYWLSVLIVLLFEGLFVKGKLALSLIFIVNFFPIAIMSNFLLSRFDYKFKTRFYMIAIPVAVLLTFVFNFFDAPFWLTSMPVVLICTGPLFEGLYVSLIIHKNDRQISKTITCILYGSGIASCFYYEFFRYNATEMQYFIGFGSAFVTYIACSMLLPIVAVHMINAKKTEVLEALVNERTKELNESKQLKEQLLRVLVHDISNPLQAAMYQVGLAENHFFNGINDFETLGKVDKNLNVIKNIISHVREYECVTSGLRTPALEDVYLKDCLAEVEEMFSERFKNKHVNLVIHNKLNPNTKIRVDKTAFVHSVASNLISNALKFSRPGSEVVISAFEKDSNIVIEVIDKGIGMSNEALRNLFDVSVATSRRGTQGEKGTGFGMPIVKAYTTIFGGHIDAHSSQDEQDSGTTISLSLPNIANREHSNTQTYLQ